MRALDAQEARALDERTINGGTPGIVLMQRAADAVAREILRAAGGSGRGARVVVLAGTGNNGGDGFEVARRLRGAPGIGSVETLLVGEPERIKGDAATTWRRLLDAGADVAVVKDADDLEPLRSATLVVDALFGTGLARPLDEESLAARAIAVVPRGAFVVAVDVPSGLDASKSEISGPAFRADLTVTFGTPKIAHLALPAAALCGRVVVADIGLGLLGPGDPDAVVARDLLRLFPRRDAAAHKGSFGRLGIVGGSAFLAGAPCLAAGAAHRSGAGLVTVIGPPQARALANVLSPESTTADPAADLSGYDALAIGPGLGTTPESGELLERALAAGRPSLLDADALNLLAGRPDRLASRRAPTVLTPHPGEAGRLLGRSADEVNASRADAARELARRANAVVVLKGFRSIVAHPEGRVAVVLAGNPGMATGGMGDVLSGIGGALLARGFSAWGAARAAAWLHGAAGDLAAERLGEGSLRARDLWDDLPGALRLVEESER